MNAPQQSTTTEQDATAARARQSESQQNRRWWLKLAIQPCLFVAAGILLLTLLGFAQRQGWISAGSGEHASATGADSDVRYICPMMCTPPRSEPGRCPVCAMELVAATTSSAASDSRSVYIDAAARRVANIQTAAVESMPLTRTIRAVGELQYDEGGLRTIAAYVDGRLDKMYADFTGVEVRQGEPLALLYSPKLYSSQLELLLARRAKDRRAAAGGAEPTRELDLYASAKERLELLGMTPRQIRELEQADRAHSSLEVCAPISGTVIEKAAVEGQYVNEGDPLYRLADLSNVWLMLKLFPEDAANVHYGQKVQAEVQSLPGRIFHGRVAFIDPKVDPKNRTVGVRVVITNQDGSLRVGDFAKATIEVLATDGHPSVVFDPELADKWISPRHPHIVSSTAGNCPICGVPLVPAAEFGFTSRPQSADGLVVPRDAVLLAGEHSVVYVETEPGRFELRRVVLGPHCGDRVVVQSGLQLGERVATRGNFLIDSQMQLAGNPSLIDPTKAEPQGRFPSGSSALAGLAPEDRQLAEQQATCPVAGFPLGSMGPPQKVMVEGRAVFICCEGCRKPLLAEPNKYFAGPPENRGPRPTAPTPNLPPIEQPILIDPGERQNEQGASRIPQAPLPRVSGQRLEVAR